MPLQPWNQTGHRGTHRVHHFQSRVCRVWRATESHKNKTHGNSPPHFLFLSHTPYVAHENTKLQKVTPPLESQDPEANPDRSGDLRQVHGGQGPTSPDVDLQSLPEKEGAHTGISAGRVCQDGSFRIPFSYLTWHMDVTVTFWGERRRHLQTLRLWSLISVRVPQCQRLLCWRIK